MLPFLLLLLCEEVGVPVETLDDEGVLEEELQQGEKGVGEVQAGHRPLSPHAHGCHQGEVGQGQLARSCGDEEEDVQVPGGVVPSFSGVSLHPVDQQSHQAAEGHQGYDGQMVGVQHEEGEVAKLLPVDPQLVKDENDQAHQEDQRTRHKAANDLPLADEVKGQLLGDVVVPRAQLAANILPHDVDHAASHQVELHAEGVEDFHTLPESDAGRVGAAPAQIRGDF